MSETPYGLIYCVLFPNGKRYIGQTCRSLERRVYEHNRYSMNGSCKMFHRAIKKHFGGSIDISHYEILEVAFSKEDLSTLEIEYIKKFNSFRKNGYNMTKGGEGVTGYIYTDEDRKKMSEIALEFFRTHPEHTIMMSEKRKKWWEDNPDAHQRASENTTNYFKNNPEKKEERSRLMKQKYEDDPSLRMKSASHFGQDREKNREGILRYWSDPVKRLEQGERMKKVFENNPEVLAQMSLTTVNLWKNEEFMKKQKSTRREKFRIDTFYAYDVLSGVKLEGEWTNVPECVESIAPQFTEDQSLLIKAVLDGKRKSSKGFTFRYAKDVLNVYKQEALTLTV